MSQQTFLARSIFLFFLLIFIVPYNLAQQKYFIEGKVVTSDNRGIQSVCIRVKRKNGRDTNPVFSDKDGNYKVEFDAGDSITITYTSDTFSTLPIESISGRTSHTITKVLTYTAGIAKLSDDDASQVARTFSIYRSDPKFYFNEIEQYLVAFPKSIFPAKYYSEFEEFKKAASTVITFCSDVTDRSSFENCTPNPKK